LAYACGGATAAVFPGVPAAQHRRSGIDEAADFRCVTGDRTLSEALSTSSRRRIAHES
jgi:hypothetical protein